MASSFPRGLEKRGWLFHEPTPSTCGTNRASVFPLDGAQSLACELMLGTDGEAIRRVIHTLYPLEYSMKTAMKSHFVSPSAAVASAAALAFLFTLSGSQVVRADDPETASPPAGQDMVLVPVKSVHALEQRVIYLEETIAALTESWQHINTHRLCVSDDSGAETCVTKAQLDSFLNQAAHAEISQPAVSEEANASPPAALIESVVTTEPTPSSEPTTIVGENVLPDQEPEYTGTVNSAASGAAVVSYPEVEIYEEPALRSDD